MPSSGRVVPLLVLCLIVLAVVVRVVPAVRQSLWLDEVVSARIIAQPSAGAAVHRVRQTESSPPGWHLLNWVVWRGSGRPRIELLRLLSVVFGAALTLLTFRFGLSLGLRPWASVVAAGLAAVGPNVVAHGAELRPYELLTLLSLLVAITVQRAVETPTPARLGALGAVVLVGAYTHYFFLLAAAVCAAWVAARAKGRTRLRVLGTMAAGLIPFLVWLPDFRFQYDHDLYAYNGVFSVKAVAYSFARIVGVASSTGAVDGVLRLAFAGVVLGGALLLVRQGRSELAGVMAVVPVAVAAFLWLLGPHIFNERNLLVSMPFAALAVGRLAEALPGIGPALMGVAVAGVAVFSLWQWELSYGRSGYSGIATALVHDGWRSGDEVVQFGPAPLGLSQPVGWYLPAHPLLVRVRPRECTTVLAMSYDAGSGARWIERHLASGTQSQSFAAFDHTPRGPRARTPIVVGRVRSGKSTLSSALAAGGRVLSDSTHPCSRIRD